MLSAAHVLAMDAKNLLDVVDSIRARFPELFVQLPAPSKPSLPFNHDQFLTESQQTFASVTSFAQSQQQRAEDGAYEVMTRQTYQNMSNLTEPHLESNAVQSGFSASTTDSQPQQQFNYQNDEQIYANNQLNSGFYDNGCIINAQLSQPTNDSDTESNTINGNNTTDAADHAPTVTSVNATNQRPEPPAKPPVAAKPVNLQNKFKAALNTNPVITNIPISMEKSSLIDEPLKIIETEQEMYGNSNAVVE